MASGPRLGKSWSAEPVSLQVDRDLDDGTELKPRSCQVSTLTLTVDASRADPATPMYVNAWFDWNQDGDWRDGGTRTCGPEWGVQNARIDPAPLGEGRIGVVTLRFRAGKVPRQFWWRAQIYQGVTLVPHRGGQAVPAGGGETEDWLYGHAPEPQAFFCSPARAIMAHGGVHDVDFRLLGKSPDLGVLRTRLQVVGEADGVIVRRPAIPDGWRLRIVSTRHHDRKPLIQSFRISLVVDTHYASPRPRQATFRAGCNVTIVHGSGPIFPPFQTAKKLTPATPSVRVAINPYSPTPELAMCGASISDGLAYFSVRTICRGVEIKATSVWFSTEKVRHWTAFPSEWSAHWLKRCGGYPSSNVLRCWWNPPNVGRILEHRVFAPAGGGQPLIVVHVHAGGTGEDGTASVLVQNWRSLGGGEFRCSQSVPPAKSCTAAN
jgi:hypothetical protein